MEANSFEFKGTSISSSNPIELVLLKSHKSTQIKGSQIQKKALHRGHVMKRRRVFMGTLTRQARVQHREVKDRGLDKRVRTLKSLVPSNESSDLQGLFRDTAEYIVALQVRVKVMRMMVDALTGSHE